MKRFNRVRLHRPAADEPDVRPQLTPALTRPIRWNLITQQHDQMIKYATAIRTRPASASDRRDEQEMFVLCRRILQSALVHVNTLMLQDVLDEPEWADPLTPADRCGLTPLFWSHVRPYGEVSLDMDARLDLAAVRLPSPEYRRTPSACRHLCVRRRGRPDRSPRSIAALVHPCARRRRRRADAVPRTATAPEVVASQRFTWIRSAPWGRRSPTEPSAPPSSWCPRCRVRGEGRPR
ncbi:Tn3 family transposase [Streptomyces sp. x-80]|uniref:Tn3 family transposase n=1 Tax=Streptomyces sp. x-80 TaxID=2789282 RepID=UPI00397F6620